jgi:hypothetical protein
MPTAERCALSPWPRLSDVPPGQIYEEKSKEHSNTLLIEWLSFSKFWLTIREGLSDLEKNKEQTPEGSPWNNPQAIRMPGSGKGSSQC